MRSPAFVMEMAGRYSTGSMKHATSGLRSLLRFLFVAGIVDRDLSAAVPAVADPRLAALPSGPDDGDGGGAAGQLRSGHRGRPAGLRDPDR